MIRRDTLSGFAAVERSNEKLRVVVVPSLGGRIVSLQDLRTGREWMWHPGEELRLFSNRPDDPFAASTLAGWDECVPTVDPCFWCGRNLPDHGEIWSLPWKEVSAASSQEDTLRLQIDLPLSPLRFVRTLRLAATQIVFNYELSNLGDEPEAILWAMHPLFTIQDGDRIQLADGARAQLGHPDWLDTLRLDGHTPASVKTFVSAEHGAYASIETRQHGSLKLTWDATWATHLGLWLSRGGWNGYHQLALEPTTAPINAPTEAPERLPMLAPGETRHWSVTLSCEVP